MKCAGVHINTSYKSSSSSGTHYIVTTAVSRTEKHLLPNCQSFQSTNIIEPHHLYINDWPSNSPMYLIIVTLSEAKLDFNFHLLSLTLVMQKLVFNIDYSAVKREDSNS